MIVLQELHRAFRSLTRSKGLALTVVTTLALGIGSNAAIIALVRTVLAKPLVNDDEERLLYIRQSAPGLGHDNATFSVPEIQDLRQRLTTITALGEFSTLPFTVIGLGEPRQVRAGVVDGNFFDAMGLEPVIGRLLTPADDGPEAEGAAVLTYRFWNDALNADPAVLGKTIRLDSIGTRPAVIVGVLEPSVPYPAETELIANVVTSAHHLSAVMETGREHRMTEVFGRLAPTADLESARAELEAVHASIMNEHREAYPENAQWSISARPLRDQITHQARPVLLVMLVASALVFVVALANVTNLILAHRASRESELALLAALGASRLSLRRALLMESLLLCGSGAAVGISLAQPLAGLLARFASRFSVRALDFSVDSSLLWVGGLSALFCAILLAFVPRLPSAESESGLRPALSGARIVGASNRRLGFFATTQIAASFILLAGALMLLKTFLTLQAADSGFETRSVLAVNVPITTYQRNLEQIRQFYSELESQLSRLPEVERVAVGSTVPWRDSGGFNGPFAFQIEGAQRDVHDDPRGRFRSVSPGFFAALDIPLLEGRDFNANDRAGEELVVIISESLAKELFPDGNVLNRRFHWSDPVMQFIGVSTEPRRIIGVVADIEDERQAPGTTAPAGSVYHPFDQQIAGGRLFVHARNDPYALVPSVTQIVRDLAAFQPVEQAATLEDIHAEVLSPNRLNAVVSGAFSAMALLISVVGVAGVLAFSVSGRTREVGIRLALGSHPRRIMMGVLGQGAMVCIAGVLTGGLGGFVLARFLRRFIAEAELPGLMPLLGSAALLLLAALVASIVPAARAARVDVARALQTE